MAEKKYNKEVLISDKNKKKATAEKVKTKEKGFKRFDETYNEFINATGGEAFGEQRLGWNQEHLKNVNKVLKEFKNVQTEIESGIRGQTKKDVKTTDVLADYLLEKAEELQCQAKILKKKCNKKEPLKENEEYLKNPLLKMVVDRISETQQRIYRANKTNDPTIKSIVAELDGLIRDITEFA